MKGIQTAGNADDDALPADVAFELLTNQRRRHVLLILAQTSPLKLGDLAERIAAQEQDTSPAELTSKQRKSVYTSLYQTHLPKLAESGLVEYDRDRGVVALADRADLVGPYLQPAQVSERRWSRRYLVLALGSAALLAAHELVWPLFSTLGVATVIVLLFFGLTIAYVRAPH